MVQDLIASTVGTRICHKVFGKSLDPEVIEGSFRLVCKPTRFRGMQFLELETRNLKMSNIKMIAITSIY